MFRIEMSAFCTMSQIRSIIAAFPWFGEKRAMGVPTRIVGSPARFGDDLPCLSVSAAHSNGAPRRERPTLLEIQGEHEAQHPEHL
jgi:hypothetical protein